jgi:hypothetical protein
MGREGNLVKATALTMFVFGLLAWLYVIIVQLLHVEWLAQPFSHLNFPPFNLRLDNVGIIAFAVSAVGFFVWQLERSN